ncbi:MAG: hypothetical protein MUD14_16930 [Hydrococcus sp. Prado102]|jgi:hypothetical protein|nr:hypothetical protein [Hydrococcus sp. Prado102]
MAKIKLTDLNFLESKNFLTESGIKQLTKEELLVISGGDNPGMGPYDPDGDGSRPAPRDCSAAFAHSLATGSRIGYLICMFF